MGWFIALPVLYATAGNSAAGIASFSLADFEADVFAGKGNTRERLCCSFRRNTAALKCYSYLPRIS
jgi:hypothetical protein